MRWTACMVASSGAMNRAAEPAQKISRATSAVIAKRAFIRCGLFLDADAKRCCGASVVTFYSSRFILPKDDRTKAKKPSETQYQIQPGTRATCGRAQAARRRARL